MAFHYAPRNTTATLYPPLNRTDVETGPHLSPSLPPVKPEYKRRGDAELRAGEGTHVVGLGTDTRKRLESKNQARDHLTNYFAPAGWSALAGSEF